MTAAEGTFPTAAPNWEPIIMKVTEEVDSQPFAKAEAPRTVRTTRIWYINNDFPDAIKLLEKVPET